MAGAVTAGLPSTAWACSNRQCHYPVSNLQSPISNTRTRAFVRIQDGCDNACTYCIIRVARGPQRSRAPDQVLAEVRARLAAGHQEIVLTGVHLGAYGRDRTGDGLGADLWTLVGRILAETVERYGAVFQLSTEDRSISLYHRMAELVRNGRIGKLKRILVTLPAGPGGPGDPKTKPVPPESGGSGWVSAKTCGRWR